MAKSCRTYWNTLAAANRAAWSMVEGSDGQLEACTLAIDERTGDYTRLTRFLPGTDTTASGGKSHEYPEEVYIISGRIYDQAFDRWLEAGDYASRPPGEVHGPFRSDVGGLVLEVSFPSQARDPGPATHRA